ncbi:MAG: beta-ketoacyl-[acyl-carrier-protein] synthase family protein [Acidobacteriia bacterium]|nr:beta-ketoacyl-[acyl-carrier-protein] synthase family protein [Terriglobia bacterium]
MGQPPHRVVVTGLGPVTSIGNGVDAFWEGIVLGRSGTRTVDYDWIHGHPFKSRVGAPVADPDPASFGLTGREAQLLDPTSRYALAAAALALRDAGLRTTPVDEKGRELSVDGIDPERTGVIIGTGIGGLCTLEKSHRAWVRGEPITGALRYSLPMLIPNALPAQVAIRYGFRGECKAVVTACASGTMALGDAYRLIRDGELDVAVAGGVEKTLSDVDGYGLLGFDLLRTLSTRNHEPERASRPFDTDRDGFVLGEGAGLLVLEREEHARARRARIHARVAGYATTSDAHSMMQIEPSGDQMVRVMERALASAGVARDEVGYVNAHGTSTRLNDPLEARALRRVFGTRIFDVWVNSTKAMTGHAIGAAGGIEAIVTVLSLARGLVHRCVNLDNPDPECDLALPRENRPLRAVAALTNSFAFGGHNATLVLAAS